MHTTTVKIYTTTWRFLIGAPSGSGDVATRIPSHNRERSTQSWAASRFYTNLSGAYEIFTIVTMYSHREFSPFFPPPPPRRPYFTGLVKWSIYSARRAVKAELSSSSSVSPRTCQRQLRATADDKGASFSLRFQRPPLSSLHYLSRENETTEAAALPTTIVVLKRPE